MQLPINEPSQLTTGRSQMQQQAAASKIQHESKNVNYASLGVTPSALNKAEQSS